MLVEAVRSFVPATGGTVNVGDVFEDPGDNDWLKAGLVVKAKAGQQANKSLEPQGAKEAPHAALRANVKEVLTAKAGNKAPTANEVEGAVKGVREKKATTAKKQARKRN